MPAHDQMQRRVNSRLQSLRNLEPEDRLKLVGQAVGLDPDSQGVLAGRDVLPMTVANGMIENVVGKFELPLAIASNFTVNGQDYLVPMVVEEPSVVAAASYMAKIARGCGGFRTSSNAPVMRAQIQVLGLSDPHAARHRLLGAEAEFMEMCNHATKRSSRSAGGAADWRCMSSKRRRSGRWSWCTSWWMCAMPWGRTP